MTQAKLYIVDGPLRLFVPKICFKAFNRESFLFKAHISKVSFFQSSEGD